MPLFKAPLVVIIVVSATVERFLPDATNSIHFSRKRACIHLCHHLFCIVQDRTSPVYSAFDRMFIMGD